MKYHFALKLKYNVIIDGWLLYPNSYHTETDGKGNSDKCQYQKVNSEKKNPGQHGKWSEHGRKVSHDNNNYYPMLMFTWFISFYCHPVHSHSHRHTHLDAQFYLVSRIHLSHSVIIFAAVYHSIFSKYKQYYLLAQTTRKQIRKPSKIPVFDLLLYHIIIVHFWMVTACVFLVCWVEQINLLLLILNIFLSLIWIVKWQLSGKLVGMDGWERKSDNRMDDPNLMSSCNLCESEF